MLCERPPSNEPEAWEAGGDQAGSPTRVATGAIAGGRTTRRGRLALQTAAMVLCSSLMVVFAGWFTLAFALPPDESLEARRLRLESLTAAEKEELLRKKDRFDRLSAEEQAQLRRLHDSMIREENADQLRRVMVHYCEWLATLTASQRAELRSLDAKQRIQRIKSLLKEQDKERFQRLVEKQLPPEDLETISAWLNQFLAQHKKDIAAALSSPRREDSGRRTAPQNLDDPGTLRRLFVFLVLFRRDFGGKPTSLETLLPNQEEWQGLERQLSPEAQRILKTISDPEQKRQLLLSWTGAAVFSQQWRRMPSVSEAELTRFVAEKLEPRDREWLESLPRDRMKRELLFLYHRHKRGGDWSRHPSPGGPRGGWPARDWRPSGDGADRDSPPPGPERNRPPNSVSRGERRATPFGPSPPPQ